MMHKFHLTIGLVVLLALLSVGCRGPVRNPAALTPMPSPEGIAPATSTILPSPTPIPTATPAIVIHVVQAGDSLYALAIHYNTTVEAIQAANGLADGAILQVGQQLRIPQEQ